MADLSTYTPIYIRTTGDDATGDGSLGAPFATAQKGFETAYLGTGNFVLDLGEGSFGGVSLATILPNPTPWAPIPEWPIRIAVRGVSTSASNLGGVNGLDAWRTSISIIGNNDANLGDIFNRGGIVSLTDAAAGYINCVGVNEQDVFYWGWNGTGGASLGGIIALNVNCTNSGYDVSGGFTANTDGSEVWFTPAPVGAVFINNVLQTAWTGWWAATEIYYIAGVATTLPQSGTGSWNNKYFINGVETPLDANGNGSWNNKYFINGVETPLDANGNGFRNGLFYVGGVLANGPVQFTNGAGGQPSSINLAQLLGLPPFVQL